MKTYVVMTLFILVGFGMYAIFLTQSDNSEVIGSKSFGTITTSLGSPFLGSTQAPITIIEFGNYQCTECQKWFQETRSDIITNYVEPEKINMIFIDTEFTKNTPLASFASYCADEQNQYWNYHDMLFQNSTDEIYIQLLKQYAIELSLDLDTFEKCLDSKKYEKKIKFSTYEAKKNGINRLPTFIIIDSSGNYEKILGFQPLYIFEEKINLLEN